MSLLKLANGCSVVPVAPVDFADVFVIIENVITQYIQFFEINGRNQYRDWDFITRAEVFCCIIELTMWVFQ